MPVYWDEFHLELYGPYISPMLQTMTTQLKQEIQTTFDDLLPVIKFLSGKHVDMFDEVSALDIFTIEWLTYVFSALNSRSFNLMDESEDTSTSEADQVG